jgi:hypothetical protein
MKVIQFLFHRLFCRHDYQKTMGCTEMVFDPWRHETWKCARCGKETKTKLGERKGKI